MKNRIMAFARFAFVSVISAAESEFEGWAQNRVKLNAGAPEFDPETAQQGSDPIEPGKYNGENYYNGGTFLVGGATSPEVPASFNYKEAIAS